MDLTKFGENLKRIRKERKWTQGDMGSRLNWSKTRICRYERQWDIPTIRTLLKVSKALSIAPEVFFE